MNIKILTNIFWLSSIVLLITASIIVFNKDNNIQKPILENEDCIIMFNRVQIPEYTQNFYQPLATASLVPMWVKSGILKTETSSYYAPTGDIVYVNKKRGRALDIGPFQMRKIAFNQVKKPGESFWELEKNPKFAEEVAARYLMYIYNGKGNRNWERTVMLYNAGPFNKIRKVHIKYLSKVKKNSV
jgi:hypothetical protein